MIKAKKFIFFVFTKSKKAAISFLVIWSILLNDKKFEKDFKSSMTDCSPVEVVNSRNFSYYKYMNNASFINTEPKIITSKTLERLLDIKGGADAIVLDEDDIQDLVDLKNNIMEKSSNSTINKSFNKNLKEFLDAIDPIVGNSTFWRIFNEMQRPLAPSLAPISSQASNNVTPVNKNSSKPTSIKELKTGIKKLKSSTFSLPQVSSFSMPNARKTDGSLQHTSGLTQEQKEYDLNTKGRRVDPLIASDSFDSNHFYSQEQTIEKAIESKHAKRDYGYWGRVRGRTQCDQETQIKIGDWYRKQIEKRFNNATGEVIVRMCEWHGQENTIVYGHVPTKTILAFEQTELHPGVLFFISSYRLNGSQPTPDNYPNQWVRYIDGWKVGLSQADRMALDSQGRCIKIKNSINQQIEQRNKDFHKYLKDIKRRTGNSYHLGSRDVEYYEKHIHNHDFVPNSAGQMRMQDIGPTHMKLRDKYHTNNPLTTDHPDCKWSNGTLYPEVTDLNLESISQTKPATLEDLNFTDFTNSNSNQNQSDEL